MLRAILREVGSNLIADKMCLLCGKVGVLFRARLIKDESYFSRIDSLNCKVVTFSYLLEIF